MTTALIEDHRAGIEALCRTYGARRLDVFGSAVRDDFDSERNPSASLSTWRDPRARSLDVLGAARKVASQRLRVTTSGAFPHG